MDSATMAKVLTTAKIENFVDVAARESGQLPADQVRTLVVDDALVDTGATMLLLPARHIEQLGLQHFRTRAARGVGEGVSMRMFSAVRLTIGDREAVMDVGEIADDLPVLIGQVPLELLDFVVDPRNQRLIPNPEHGGQHIIEAY
ncbi:MAG: aspartyl protease family protein [Isosphaeraceae bacterium]